MSCRTYIGTSNLKTNNETCSLRMQSIFQSGDAILTVYDTNAVGRLGLPRGLNSQRCVDTNPAGGFKYILMSWSFRMCLWQVFRWYRKLIPEIILFAAFLYDQSFGCVREISDLLTQCQSPELDAHTYFSNFKIITVSCTFVSFHCLRTGVECGGLSTSFIVSLSDQGK